jgi:hypothetical protein
VYRRACDSGKKKPRSGSDAVSLIRSSAIDPHAHCEGSWGQAPAIFRGEGKN